jgi:hypothetical protein
MASNNTGDCLTNHIDMHIYSHYVPLLSVPLHYIYKIITLISIIQHEKLAFQQYHDHVQTLFHSFICLLYIQNYKLQVHRINALTLPVSSSVSTSKPDTPHCVRI